MAIPSWTGSNPSRYEPNPADDRALTGPASAAYLAVATALEAVTDDIPADVYRTLPPGARKAIRTAEGALRRAAFTIVLYAED